MRLDRFPFRLQHTSQAFHGSLVHAVEEVDVDALSACGVVLWKDIAYMRNDSRVTCLGCWARLLS